MTPEQVFQEIWTATEPFLQEAEAFVAKWSGFETHAAFLLGVAAVLTRARILIIGVCLLFGEQVAITIGYFSAETWWVSPVAVGFLLVGLLQGIVVMLLGDEGGPQLMAFLFFTVLGFVLFLVWRGPKRAVQSAFVRFLSRRV